MGDSRNESFHESVAEGGCPRRPKAGSRAPPRGRKRWTQPRATETAKSRKLRREQGRGLRIFQLDPISIFQSLLQIGKVRN